MDEKKYVKLVFSLIAAIALLGAVVIIIIDPYFHYHAPIKGLAYQFDTPDERYVNNGIVKHFKYDALITGTSMTEKFKASECDELFDANTIKVPLNGAYYKEINRLINKALESNPDIKYVFRSLDYSMMKVDKDMARAGHENFPTYLYDENPFNDVNYIFNKTVLIECIEVIQNTLTGKTTTTFDEYAADDTGTQYGRGPILRYQAREPKAEGETFLTEEEKIQVAENIIQNVESTVKAYPNVQFYMFFTPYSVYYWDNLVQRGHLRQHVEVERIIIERLVHYDNVHLFSFSNNFDVTCNEYNYEDIAHYGPWINSDILEWMAEGKWQLTEDNYEAYLQELIDFYSVYDFASMYIY